MMVQEPPSILVREEHRSISIVYQRDISILENGRRDEGIQGRVKRLQIERVIGVAVRSIEERAVQHRQR